MGIAAKLRNLFVTYGNIQREIKRQRQMDEGVATPPRSRTERNKARINRGFSYKLTGEFGDSRRITKDSSWITSAPSGITVKSDFRVAFFIQPPSQPLLAGVVRHLLISLPNLKYGAKQRITAGYGKLRVS